MSRWGLISDMILIPLTFFPCRCNGSVRLPVILTIDYIISLAVGPYYLQKSAATVIDQDAGYWMLVGAQRKSRFIGDAGLTRYSVLLISIQGDERFLENRIKHTSDSHRNLVASQTED
jgi:hypothetical protein